jgi:hypothetical protein
MVTSTAHVGKTQPATLTGEVYKVAQVHKGLNTGLMEFTLVERAFVGAPSRAGCPAPAADGFAAMKLSASTLSLLNIK